MDISGVDIQVKIETVADISGVSLKEVVTDLSGVKVVLNSVSDLIRALPPLLAAHQDLSGVQTAALDLIQRAAKDDAVRAAATAFVDNHLDALHDTLRTVALGSVVSAVTDTVSAVSDVVSANDKAAATATAAVAIVGSLSRNRLFCC